MSFSVSPGIGQAYIERRSILNKYHPQLTPVGKVAILRSSSFDRNRYSLLRGATPVSHSPSTLSHTRRHQVTSEEHGARTSSRRTENLVPSHPLESNVSATLANKSGSSPIPPPQDRSVQQRRYDHDQQQQELMNFVNKKVERFSKLQDATSRADSNRMESIKNLSRTTHPKPAWNEVMENLALVFNAMEATMLQSDSDATVLKAEADQWRERAEEEALKREALREKAEVLAMRMEDTLAAVEAQLAEARAKWEREAGAGLRRRNEDRELMLEQCKRWEGVLEGAARHLERHLRGHNEMKFRSLALCSTIESRVGQLEQHLTKSAHAN